MKSDTKNLSDADTDEVLSTEPGPEGFIRVTFYDPAPGVSPSQLVDMLHSKGTKSAQVVKNVKSTAGTGQPSASPMVAAGSPSDCVLGSALWTWCPIKAWANNGYARPIIRVNDHTGSGWTTDTQVAQINRAPKVDTHYLWNSCPLQAGARCFDAWSGNYGITGWVGITSIWVTNSYTLPEQAPDEQQQNGLYLNDWYNPAGSETGCGPDLSEGCTPFVKDHIILHELGHMWGLDHSGDPSDFMAAAQQAPGIPWNYIPSDSFSLLNQVYSVPH